MVKPLLKSPSPLCPCESGLPYTACCQPYHQGEWAPNAEVLMRSRYTAYVLGLEAYLLATWHPNTRPVRLDLTANPPLKWMGLTVKSWSQPSPNSAIVEFVARYKCNGKAERLEERSTFIKDDRWYYLSGTYA